MNYFECKIPSASQRCCHESCPCSDVFIPYGAGYLYIKESLIKFRCQYPVLESAKRARQHKLEQLHVLSDLGDKITKLYRIDPALVCQQCAKQLQIDLDVAAADAKYWWETGQVPLRVTPMAGTVPQKTPIAEEPSTAVKIFIFILLAIFLVSSIYLFIRGHYIWGSIFTVAFLVTLVSIKTTPEQNKQRQEREFTEQFEETKKRRDTIKPLSKLTCSKCKEVYLIGVDSDMIIGDDTLMTIIGEGTGIPTIFPTQRVPDIIDHYRISDDRWVILAYEIQQLKYGIFPIKGNKSDVQRQWLCSNCNSINTSNL